jgi:hypothetical protein
LIAIDDRFRFKKNRFSVLLSTKPVANDLKRPGEGVFGSGHLGRTYGTDNTPSPPTKVKMKKKKKHKDVFY